MAKPTAKAKKKTMQHAAPFASYMNLSAESQQDDEQSRRAEKEDEWAKKAESDPDREQLEDESDDDYATRMEEMDDKEAKADGEIKDDPEAEDDADDEKAKAIRASERKRCARIIAHGIKAGNVHQAAVFAFDTDLTATQAVSAMNAAKMDTPRGGLGSRMQGVQNHNIGSNGDQATVPRSKAEAETNSILDAVKAARG